MANLNEPRGSVHFEKEFGDFAKLGTLIIKGTVDRQNGNITGEIGVKALGVYRSLHPFAGNLHDGVHGKFATGVGYGDSSFVINIKDGAVVAQANMWEKGTQMTLFKLEELGPSYKGKLQMGEYFDEVGTTVEYGLKSHPLSMWFDFILPPSATMQMGLDKNPLPVEFIGPLSLKDGYGTYTATLLETGLDIQVSNGAMIKGKVSDKAWKETLAGSPDKCIKIEGGCRQLMG
ncbi:uncharacterized protein BO97DRAFT_415079 [Aspergillus homomorphus CBS 101889]|uniref:Uncharacterized protein n=1 Tax=Aspergillus homomorphus (strain CBS 101889) TaxID=1450537 RepID=A0A395HZ08_ASPHC|nr:hypothetical protein BO97DRAFT_415079 [Aspergillus homomorphus CBS 101889]RAL11494.1 hypothetical protein BO97DRAFT_415079 [Aspergillus homomorphus CBS 101889]